MALSDLFPYGAPELVEGADPRMSRSLVGAALLVTSVFVVGGMLVSRAVALAPPETTDDPPPVIIVLEPPPSIDDAGGPIATVNRSAVDATPVPVRDVLVPPDLVLREPGLPDAPVADGPVVDGTVAGGRDSMGRGPSEDVLPIGAYVDLMPELLSGAAPQYPDLARESGTEGRIRVLMRVGTDGRVREARIAPGPSIAVLEEAALEAARTCRFVPARSNGRLVSVWVARTYEFRLH